MRIFIDTKEIRAPKMGENFVRDFDKRLPECVDLATINYVTPHRIVREIRPTLWNFLHFWIVGKLGR